MTEFIVLSLILTPAGVCVGWWLGRPSWHRLVQPIAPIGTSPPTELVNTPDWD